MRLKNLLRRPSRPTQGLSFQRAVRLRVELLEERWVPSTIDYSMGFADPSALTASGSASFPVIAGNTVAQLTDGGTNETGTIFTNDTVGTGQFHTDFTFVQAAGQTNPAGGELDFIFANEGRSVGIYFAPPTNSTGITLNGQAQANPRISLNGSGIDLGSQDAMHVAVDYDGTNLTWTIQDTTTRATSPTFSVSLSIPSLVGSTANVGFSGSTDTSAAVQYVLTWQGSFNSVPSPAVPTLSSLGTTSAVEGSSGLTVTLNGSNFSPQSQAQWNGANLGTVFVSPNQLIAIIPASLLAEAGTAAVTVFTPGLGTTAAQTFTITEAGLTGNGVSFTASPGIAFTGVVATFSAADTNAPLSNFTALIDWGNGTASVGTITPLGNGNFQVSGTNTYSESGTFPVSVTITDVGGGFTTLTSTANVGGPFVPTLSGLSITSVLEGTNGLSFAVNGSNFTSNSTVQFNGTDLATTFINGNQLIAVIPASLLAHPGIASVAVFTPGLGATAAQSFTVTEGPLTGSAVNFNASAGTAFNGVVAGFLAADTNAPVSDFTATIDWGDGTTSAGTITSLGGGMFQVSGTNTYMHSGTYPVTITVTDVGGGSTTINDTATVDSGVR